MSILFPLMALGALAVAVPIWLHLRRRDENNLVEFSTLRFLDDQPVARARPLLPRNWPLLILRLIALVSLIAAFMWPYVEGKETVIVEESRVYILDNTLSYQLDDAFIGSRDQIVEELNRQEIRTQIGVVELASTATIVARFGDDKDSAAQKVAALQPADERGAYYEAFRSASELLSNSLGKTRRIVLLSDSQANQWTLGDDSPPFLDSIKIEIPQQPDKPLSNVSLSGARAQRVVREGKHWIEAGVVASVQGDFDSVVVVFRNGGNDVARQEIELDSDSDQPVQSGFVLADWQVDPSDWVLGEIVIEAKDDALAGDNRVVFSLPPLRPGRVDLIADSLFLRQALQPEVMLGRWETQQVDPNQKTDQLDAHPSDVLCVESHWLSSTAVRNTILDNLNSGKGVMLLVDQASPLVAGFLREIGIDFQPTQRQSSDPATFRYVFAEHPIFASFRSGELGNLSEIEFSNYRRLQVRDSVPLAFSASGDPLLFEVQGGTGRMLIFAFSMDRDDTNWPIHPSFIPFLDRTLDYLRGTTVNATEFEPGELVTWDLQPGTSATRAVISPLDPGTRTAADTAVAPVEVEVNQRQARFRVPSKSGHYAIRYDDNDLIAAVLDVNPSPLESELVYDSAPRALDAWQEEEQSAQATDSDEFDGIELTTLEALQQHYWWYLLLVAALAFAAETMLSARVSYDS